MCLPKIDQLICCRHLLNLEHFDQLAIKLVKLANKSILVGCVLAIAPVKTIKSLSDVISGIRSWQVWNKYKPHGIKFNIR